MGKNLRCKLGIHDYEWSHDRVGSVCKFCGKYRQGWFNQYEFDGK